MRENARIYDLNNVDFSSDTNKPTLLVIRGKTMDENLKYCPRQEPFVLFNANNPTEFVLAGCKALKCVWCGPIKARQVVHGISWVASQVDRTRWITFTRAPEDAEKRRQKMADMMRWCGKQGFPSEWIWTTEAGKETGMIHIHAVQHGGFIPHDVLYERWGAAVRIEEVKTDAAALGNYMAKGATKLGNYMSKSASSDYAAWYHLNNKRPFRQSRGFFLGVGVEEAVKRGKLLQRQGPPPEWVGASPAFTLRALEIIQMPREEQEEARKGLAADFMQLGAEA